HQWGRGQPGYANVSHPEPQPDSSERDLDRHPPRLDLRTARRHLSSKYADRGVRRDEGVSTTAVSARATQSATAAPRLLRGKAGQAIVLLALTGTLMIGGVGVAVDLAVGYMYSIATERPASAAALAGGAFMPNQFTSAQAIPAGSRNAATDRAIDEAKRNGFDPANTQEGVVVVPAVISGRSNQLR